MKGHWMIMYKVGNSRMMLSQNIV